MNVRVLTDRKLKIFLQNISIVSVEMSVGDVFDIFISECDTGVLELSAITLRSKEVNITLSAAALI